MRCSFWTNGTSLRLFPFFFCMNLNRTCQVFLKFYFCSLSWIQIEHWSEAETTALSNWKETSSLLEYSPPGKVGYETSGFAEICAYICIYTHRILYTIHWHASSCQDLWITQFKPIKYIWNLWNFKCCVLTCNGTALSWAQCVWKDRINYKWQAHFPQYYRSNSQLPFTGPEFCQNRF